MTSDINPAPQSETAAPTADTSNNAEKPNNAARVSFVGALSAQTLFIISAMFDSLFASGVCAAASLLLALASFIAGCVALKRRPRTLAITGMVLAGVIILIFAMLVVVYVISRDLIMDVPTVN